MNDLTGVDYFSIVYIYTQWILAYLWGWLNILMSGPRWPILLTRTIPCDAPVDIVESGNERWESMLSCEGIGTGRYMPLCWSRPLPAIKPVLLSDVWDMSHEVEEDIDTRGISSVSSAGGGCLHCGSGPATSSVRSSGPACITAWRSFPFSGRDLSITWRSASGGSGRWTGREERCIGLETPIVSNRSSGLKSAATADPLWRFTEGKPRLLDNGGELMPGEE